jgi:hypothetical protein
MERKVEIEKTDVQGGGGQMDERMQAKGACKATKYGHSAPSNTD